MNWYKQRKIAFPVTDYLTNLHHKDVRKHAPNGMQVEVFHGIPLNWIEEDPDDTKLDTETGEMNESGRSQGMVSRSINIKRIRGISVRNPVWE